MFITFVVVATIASAAAAAKNALPTVKRRYDNIRLRLITGVFMEFGLEAGVGFNAARLPILACVVKK